MFAAVKQASSRDAFDDLIEDDGRNLSQLSIDDDIDDPFADTKPAAAPVKASAAAAAFGGAKPAAHAFAAAKPSLLSSIVNNARNGASAFSESEASDDYSADDFSQEKSPTAAKHAEPAASNKLAAMFGGKKKEERKARSPSRSRSPSPFSSHDSKAKPAAAARPAAKPAAKPSAAAAAAKVVKKSSSAGRSRSSRSRSRSPSNSRSRSRSASRSRSRSASHSRSRSRTPPPRKSGGMSKLKALLTKDRSGAGGNKSFMDEQKEKLESNPHYVKRQKQLALKKLAAAGFMASAKQHDYSKEVSGLLSDIKNCSFRPKLSAGTRDLLERGGHMPVFSERLKGYIQSKIDKHNAMGKLNKDTFSFQPQLNHDDDKDEAAKDKETKRKEFEERAASDLRRRKEELAAKQRAPEPGCTFTPQLNPYRPKSAKLRNKGFEQRYYDDLEKRDAGLEAKIAAAKLQVHPFAPQITNSVRVKGSFLERTVRDVELRNKKMRYRAKLMDVEPPVHGRITVPDPADDLFYQNEQRKLSRSSTARDRFDGEEHESEDLNSSVGSAHRDGGHGSKRALGLSSSMGRFAGLSAGLISTFGGNKGVSMAKATARPEVVSESLKPLPKRGKKMSSSKRKEYDRAIRERKRAEKEAERARNHNDAGDDDRVAGGGKKGSQSSSASSSRRSSVAPSGSSQPARSTGRSGSKRGGSRSRSRSHSRSRSRSRSRSHSRSRSPSPASKKQPSRRPQSAGAALSKGRSRARSSSRSKSPSRSRSGSRSRSHSGSHSSDSDSVFGSHSKHRSRGKK